MRVLVCLLICSSACLTDYQSSNGAAQGGANGGENIAAPDPATTLTWGPFTITFDRPVVAGTFLQTSAPYPGDPWVHLAQGETVTIQSITAPHAIGTMLNPADAEKPAFHPSMSGTNPAQFPLTLTSDGAIDSLVVGEHSDVAQTPIERYMIISFVPTVPLRNGDGILRPGATGSRAEKKMWDLDAMPLASLVTTRALPQNLAGAEDLYEKICRASDYDYFFNLSGGQFLQGIFNSGGVRYGAYKAAHYTALYHRAISPSTPQEDRRRYLACLIQRGADVYHNVRFAGMRYREGGGQGHGRWLPFALFAAASNDADAKAFALTAAAPRPDASLGLYRFEEFDHYYYSTAQVNGAPLNRVLYGDAEAYGWTYDCLLNGTCANPPQASYWGTMDAHQVIDGGIGGTAYFTTIESALAIAVDAAASLASVDALVDPRMRERVRSFAFEGFRTQPDPYQSERPGQAAKNGVREYDGQLNSGLVSYMLARLGAQEL